MKRRDPIIEDLHKLREKIGRAHAFDVERIAATVRQHEAEGRTTIVHDIRRPAGHKKAS